MSRVDAMARVLRSTLPSQARDNGVVAWRPICHCRKTWAQSERMNPKNLFTPRHLTLVGALLLFGLMAFALHGVLVALAIALVASYLLNPSVVYLQALRVPRVFGALIVLLTVVASALFVVFVGVPGVAHEILEAKHNSKIAFPTLLAAPSPLPALPNPAAFSR